MPPEHPTTESPHGLLAWARAELRRRIDAGEPCGVEGFLSEYPALASDPDPTKYRFPPPSRRRDLLLVSETRDRR